MGELPIKTNSTHNYNVNLVRHRGHHPLLQIFFTHDWARHQIDQDQICSQLNKIALTREFQTWHKIVKIELQDFCRKAIVAKFERQTMGIKNKNSFENIEQLKFGPEMLWW